MAPLTSYARGVRTSYAILVTVFVSLAGCTDHGAAKLTKIKDKVCACTTASCAEQAMAEVETSGAETNHRTQTIARAMMDCLAKLEAKERPTTDPDADTGSDAPAPAPAPEAK
jgi:hypothetical protein